MSSLPTTADEFLLQVDEILAEPMESVLWREQHALDEIIDRFHGRLVLFGAGSLGGRSAKGLSQLGVRPLAFSDNSRGKWGTAIEGIPVLPPAEAAEQYGKDAAFLITIWTDQHRFAETSRQLSGLGCQHVLSASPIYWRLASSFLPNYCQDAPHKVYEKRERVRRAATLWADTESRIEFLCQLRWRAFGDFSAFRRPTAAESYFVDDIFRLRREDLFIDCGAYDGCTLQTLLRRSGSGAPRACGLEPDPHNYARLKHWHSTLPVEAGSRITLHNCAVGTERGKVPFQADGTVGSMITDHGSTLVDCIPLDELLAEEQPTYIKMDIEGFELQALAGGARAIRKNRPILAICSYHKQNDLWDIPLAIHDLNGDYRLFLRLHEPDGWQLVTYAVPAERLLE